MSANRHLGRIIVLQTLYEQAIRAICGDKNVNLNGVLARNISRYRASLDDESFIKELARGVDKKSEGLDKKLQPIAAEWPLQQIARIDHMILRMGAYELTESKGVPPKVVINEAVELAKAFGGENSSKFINGVLGTLLKQTDPKFADKKTENNTVKKTVKKSTKKSKQ